MPTFVMPSHLQGFLALVSCLSPSSPRMLLHLGARTLFSTVRLKASRPSLCDGGRTASSSRRAGACASCPTDHCTSPMWGVQQSNQMRASISASSKTNMEPSWAKDLALQSQVSMEGGNGLELQMLKNGWALIDHMLCVFWEFVKEHLSQIEEAQCFQLYLSQILLCLSQNQCKKCWKRPHALYFGFIHASIWIGNELR